MADTIFERKDYQGKKYLVTGKDCRYQVDTAGYVWSADGKDKIGFLKETYWNNEKWFKVMVNNSHQGWVQ